MAIAAKEPTTTPTMIGVFDEPLEEFELVLAGDVSVEPSAGVDEVGALAPVDVVLGLHNERMGQANYDAKIVN